MTKREVRGQAARDESAASSRLVSESMIVPLLAAAPNPFPGLRAYGADEAHLFFGREAHVEALLAKLCRQRLITVIGASGSGKSSLALAGIVPRLMRGYRASSGFDQASVGSSWCIARMRPGDDPIKNLACALHESSETREREQDSRAVNVSPDSQDGAAARDLELALLEAQLRRNQSGLREASAQLLSGSRDNLLLIVDQFEELFRFRELSRRRTQLHDPASAFVQLLLRATEQSHVPVYVMLTMRSDFIGECVQFTGLPEAINEGQYLLPLLNRDQREQVIRGPLAVANSAIEPALVQRLLNDAGNMTDQLPVLQHALMRSFDLCRAEGGSGAQLTAAHYDRCGGMQGALSMHADEVLAEVEAELGAQGLRIVESMFRALTEAGPHGSGVRRPCGVSELLAVTGSDLAALRKVVARFGAESRGFVVVQPAGRELDAESTLDISHEALMRLWRRLKEWSGAELVFAQQLRALHDAARKYEHGAIGPLGDPELTLALSFMEREQPTAPRAARYGADLTRIDAFLRASVAAREASLALARDARTLQRLRRTFSEAKVSTLLSMLAVIVLVLLQGSGLLDGVVRGSTRFKLLSVSARHMLSPAGLHRSLAAVAIDGQTVAALRGQSRHGQLLGDFGSNWRSLQAELLTKLASAGAKAVVFDIDFQASAGNTALAETGSMEMAAAIRFARSQGTAVVIAGDLATHAAVRAALEQQSPAGSNYAPGIQANPCVSLASEGAAVFANLLSMREGAASVPGLALAGLTSFWRTPHAFVDAPTQTLFLVGPGGQKRVPFAGVGRELDSGECYPARIGDQPAQQILDLPESELTGAYNPPRLGLKVPSILPFEQLLAAADLAPFQLAGTLVLVGKQYRDDHHDVRGGRWGMSLHLTALNDLLMGRAIRPIAPWSQLMWMLLLCVIVAWQRLRTRDQAPWKRRAALLGLMAANVTIVALSAMALDLLMDESYQLFAMLVTYVMVGRLDKHAARVA